MNEYYSNFINTNKKPNEQIINNLKNQVTKKFYVASNYYTIEEETEFGSLIFQNISVRITNVSDAKTGQRINDDFKNIIFSDFNHNVTVGQRYRFDDNIWIVYSTDNIKTITDNVYIRRCNNTINMQDEYGVIHKEPCVIDYKMLETRVYYQENIDVSQGKIWIQVQKNKWTSNININYRVLFDTLCYKIRNVINFDKRNTFVQNSYKLMSFYAEIDNLNEYDNLDLEIADYKNYDYNISVIDNLSISNNTTGTLVATVYLNGQTTAEPVTWTSSDTSIITINQNGEYQSHSEGTCNIICKMTNKNSTYNTITIVVSEILTKENNILPENNIIFVGDENTYTVYEYENGIKTNTTFNISSNGTSNKYYILTTTDNSFSIKCLRSSNLKLIITCKNRTDNTIITKSFELRSY